jgi:hypothetical protein
VFVVWFTVHWPPFGRYRTLGRFDASWAGLPIAPSFHLDARDAVLGRAPLGDAAASPLAAAAVDGSGDGNTTTTTTTTSSIASTSSTNRVNVCVTAEDAEDAADAATTTATAAAAATAMDAAARAFYRAQVLFDTGGAHASELDRQLRSNVCLRLTHVADALGARGSSGGGSSDGGGDSLGAAPAPPPLPVAPESTSRNRLSVGIAGDVGGARSTAASLKAGTEEAAASRTADALALVGARLVNRGRPSPGRDSLAAAPVEVGAADDEAAALPAGGDNAAPAAPPRAPAHLGFQKAWILSSVAQQYL